jgi:hypothetical protein
MENRKFQMFGSHACCHSAYIGQKIKNKNDQSMNMHDATCATISRAIKTKTFQMVINRGTAVVFSAFRPHFLGNAKLVVAKAGQVGMAYNNAASLGWYRWCLPAKEKHGLAIY